METTGNSSHFFQNRACEHFPCHEGIPEEDFNCLFCFCPLYTLGKRCGGNWRYTDKGTKSCRECIFPHERENYDQMISRFEEIKAVVRRSDGEKK